MEGISVRTTLGGIKLSDGKGIKKVTQTVTPSSQRGYNLSTPVFCSNKLADSLKQIHAKKNYTALFILKNLIYSFIQPYFFVYQGNNPFLLPQNNDVRIRREDAHNIWEVIEAISKQNGYKSVQKDLGLLAAV